MSRILVINPFGGTEFYGRANLERIKRPDTQFDMVNIADVYPLTNNQWIYFKYMCTDGTLERIIKAEKEGYDAVAISCNLDIGLYEARQLVDIPVTATLESAALTAHMMGWRYALLSVDDQNGKIQEMMLENYGLAAHYVGHKAIGIDANDLYPDITPAAAVRKAALAAGKFCVENLNAEVLIAGCTLVGSVLTHTKPDPVEVLGVPVLDGMITGFKMAEMMADLRAAGFPTVSRKGFFEKPPRPDYERLRTFLHRPL
jgi:Asp/Glu/hydantoin racemase